MKQQIETIKRRVGAIRRNPDMTPTHAALAISEVADALESIDGRLAALEADAKRYRWLAARLLAADFDYNGDGVQALVFELPVGCAVSADCNATIDAAMLAKSAVGAA